MKTITLTYPIRAFEYDDLGDEAKEKAIADRAEFLLDLCNSGLLTEKEFASQYPVVVRAIEKAEAMLTPWFTVSYIIDYCRDMIEEEIKMNDYLFSDNGNLLPVRYYWKEDVIERIAFRIGCTEHPVTIE